MASDFQNRLDNTASDEKVSSTTFRGRLATILHTIAGHMGEKNPIHDEIDALMASDPEDNTSPDATGASMNVTDEKGKEVPPNAQV